eukprot:gene11891-18344_t
MLTGEVELEVAADCVNKLADFCSVRDVDELSPACLKEVYGFEKADLLILFGASVPHACDVVARAILDGVCEKWMIVGGEGHTTESLR